VPVAVAFSTKPNAAKIKESLMQTKTTDLTLRKQVKQGNAYTCLLSFLVQGMLSLPCMLTFFFKVLLRV
jgi:hypothetical protein